MADVSAGADHRREVLVEMFTKCVRDRGIDADMYAADIEHMEHAIEKFADIRAKMGGYEMCALLLTSPRLHRPQREIIEEQAYRLKAELESEGVQFIERGPRT